MTKYPRLPKAEINGNQAETFSRRMLGEVPSRSPLRLQERGRFGPESFTG